MELDVHPFVSGADLDRVWTNRVSGRFGATPVSYASLDDLIAMEEAAGRAKDLEDLKALREIRRRRQGRAE